MLRRRGIRLAAWPVCTHKQSKFRSAWAVPQECWPCKSNPVRLGSSASRAKLALVAFGLSAGVLAAGPVQPVYSSEPYSETSRRGVESPPWPASWRRSASGSVSARSLRPLPWTTMS